mmetsp:Transcript_134837/g.234398  ORF Transcript_134837/g.234398 Transcript_134837/m.234398 type:complete len:106 (+) Transcript_134837:140-457(+)
MAAAGKKDEESTADMGESEESVFHKCCLGCLDCMAAVIRCITAVWHTFVWMFQRSCYPVKEFVIDSYDSCFMPDYKQPLYRRQKLQAHVPYLENFQKEGMDPFDP